ncbi:MAG: CRTAC1 family protein [Gammaproteobacteria bacterium]|nr:CRTAC1 family protein [Gammaproteobacteria bacterium]
MYFARFSAFGKWRRHAAIPIACLCAMTGAGCEGNDKSATKSNRSIAPVFQDMARASGLVFKHDSGATGQYYMPEIMGAGIALLDYDGDDDLDIFVLQGKQLEPETAGAAIDARSPPGHRLFRNELIPSGTLRFVDVTEAAGIGDRGYGMGVAVGDIDNDGDPDLYLTHFGPNALYLNDGGGRFHRAMESSTEDDRFGSSAAFLDYDADGLLDLVVANYNTFAISNHQACRDIGGPQDYCDPTSYPPAVDKIFRNLDAGKFADVTAETGVYEHFGTGLGVVAADFNNDGGVDIYVANDKMANIYWINDGSGHFVNEALMSGAAYDANGVAEASMGVVAGDVDGDGDDDLFMTHLNGQTNTLYLNDGSGRFRDATDQLNLGVSSLPYTGFGTVWIDYDNDSDHDLLIANGAVLAQETGGDDRFAKYGQRNQFYRNDGTGKFEEISEVAGESFQLSRISRGVAVGDIDNDGDLDAVISNTDGPAELLINRGEPKHHWVSVKLRGIKSNRNGAGARVALLRPNGDRIWRRAHTDGSYLSASDIRVHFGLGSNAQISGIGVIWPAGGREIWTGINANTRIELVEGGGQPWSE